VLWEALEQCWPIEIGSKPQIKSMCIILHFLVATSESEKKLAKLIMLIILFQYSQCIINIKLLTNYFTFFTFSLQSVFYTGSPATFPIPKRHMWLMTTILLGSISLEYQRIHRESTKQCQCSL
jgi:hypothetical protein